MLCIWCDQKDVLYYVLIKPGGTSKRPVKYYLENVCWKVLPHEGPDLASSDYQLFWSMLEYSSHQNGIKSLSIKNWLDSFLIAEAQFFWDEIYKLPVRWENIIASDEKILETILS